MNKLRAPTPELAAALSEQVGKALASLPNDTVRNVAEQRLEGYSNGEIGERLGVRVSSVERKLRVIREIWRRAFE